MKVLSITLFVLSSLLISCGADESGANRKIRNSSSDQSSSSLPKELYYLAAMESSLELQFLASDKLETLKDSTIDRIIGYHSKDYLENYDQMRMVIFQTRNYRSFNEVSTRIARDIDEQKRNYLSIKGKMDSKTTLFALLIKVVTCSLLMVFLEDY